MGQHYTKVVVIKLNDFFNFKYDFIKSLAPLYLPSSQLNLLIITIVKTREG